MVKCKLWNLVKERQQWLRPRVDLVVCFLWYLGLLWSNLNIIYIKRKLNFSANEWYQLHYSVSWRWKSKYKTIHKFWFFTFIFLDIHNSVKIIHRLPKSFLLVFAMVIEGTVSHISYLGPRFWFMCFQKLSPQFYLNVSRKKSKQNLDCVHAMFFEKYTSKN